MLTRFIAITLGLLGLSLWACVSKDDSTPSDPAGAVEMPGTTRNVVDAGLVILDMDADVYGPGGGAGVSTPDAGLRPDVASANDAAVDSGGAGAPCELLATNTCPTRYGCYPKSGGGGSCQLLGFLPGGSNCDQSSPDSRCMLGYNCLYGICMGLCHVDGPNIAAECKDSMGSTCAAIKDAAGDPTKIGHCASN